MRVFWDLQVGRSVISMWYKECLGHLVFALLMNRFFSKDKECAGHLLFLFLMTSSFKQDKECVGHLVCFFFLTGHRLCRHHKQWVLRLPRDYQKQSLQWCLKNCKSLVTIVCHYFAYWVFPMKLDAQVAANGYSKACDIRIPKV